MTGIRTQILTIVSPGAFNYKPSFVPLSYPTNQYSGKYHAAIVGIYLRSC